MESDDFFEIRFIHFSFYSRMMMTPTQKVLLQRQKKKSSLIMPIRHSSLLTHNSPEDVLTFRSVEKKVPSSFLFTRLDSDSVQIIKSLSLCTF